MGQFSEIFSTHLKKGTGLDAPEKETKGVLRWSDVGFALKCKVWPKSVADWRKGLRVPSDSHLEVIFDGFFGPDPAHLLEREKLREAARYDRIHNDGITFGCFGTGQPDRPSEMPPSVLECYETLFNEDEQVLWRDLIGWLEVAANDENHNWVELFFTMYKRKKCIGFAYISMCRPKRWFYGSYFGILPKYRFKDEARRLLIEVVTAAERVTPTADGIVFEAHPFNTDLLDAVLARCKAKKWLHGENIELSDEERESLIAARRIEVYTKHALARAPVVDGYKSKRSPGCLTVMSRQPDGTTGLAPYMQPAMYLPLNEENEFPYALLIYPFETLLRRLDAKIEPGREKPWPHKEVNNLLDFIYTHSYGSAYTPGYHGGTSSESAIPGYGEYLPKILERVKADFARTDTLLMSRNVLPPSARTLFTTYKSLMEASGIIL